MIANDHYGSGTAWYVATRLDPAGLDDLLAAVLAEAGLGAPPLLPAGLETVTRSDGDHHYTFWFNHADHDHQVPDHQPRRWVGSC